jgi:hypothetical protein
VRVAHVCSEGRLAHAGQAEDDDRPIAGEALAQLGEGLAAGHGVAWGVRNGIELGGSPTGAGATLTTRLSGQVEQPGGHSLIPLQAERGDEERRQGDRVRQTLVLFQPADLCLAVADCEPEFPLGQTGPAAQIFQSLPEGRKRPGSGRGSLGRHPMRRPCWQEMSQQASAVLVSPRQDLHGSFD